MQVLCPGVIACGWPRWGMYRQGIRFCSRNLTKSCLQVGGNLSRMFANTLGVKTTCVYIYIYIYNPLTSHFPFILPLLRHSMYDLLVVQVGKYYSSPVELNRTNCTTCNTSLHLPTPSAPCAAMVVASPGAIGDSVVTVAT